MKVFTASVLAASLAASYPNSKHGSTVSDLQAGADTVNDLQAMGVKDFSSISSKLQYVRAKENFFAQGSLVEIGDIVQLPEGDARLLIRAERAVEVTDDEVAAAKAPAKAGK